MRLKPKPGLSILALLLLLTALSCPGTETIVVDVGDFVVVIVTNNLAATRYESIGFQVFQLELAPEDPDAQDALAGDTIGILRFPENFDLNQQSITLPSVPLHSGQYRVTEFIIENIVMVDNSPPAVPTTCFENFSTIPDGQVGFPTTGRVEFTDLGDPISTVSPDGGQLTVQIDAEQFASALESAIICVDTPGDTCIIGVSRFDAPCMRIFLENVFTSQSQNFLSFN